MKTTKSFLVLLLTLFSTSITAFAQSNDGAACAAVGISAVVGLVVGVAIYVVITVLIIKWIKKDAAAKGMPNADSIKWLGLLNWVGAVIYILMRPKTNQ